MQQDCESTTASEVTAKHRNNRRAGGGGATAPDLLTVLSSESSHSTVSQRRLMRLSEKMSMVRSRSRGQHATTTTDTNNDGASDVPLSPNSTTEEDGKDASGALSPTYSVQKGKKGHQERSPTTSADDDKDPNDHDGDNEEEEDDILSDFSPRKEHPPRDAQRSGTTNAAMDRIESQRVDKSPRKNHPRENFQSHSSLAHVPEGEPVRQHPHRQRTPGGAAAKVMLVGPHGSGVEDNDGVLTPRGSPASSTGSEQQFALQASLDRARTQAKSQFNMRPVSESQVQGPDDEKPVDTQEYRNKLVEESPHLFDRTEVFYSDAEAAITALQTSRSFMPSDSQSVHSRGSANVMSSDNISVAASVTSAFQTPSEFDGDAHFESVSRRDVSDELLNYKVQQMIECMPDEMRDPNPTLASLLQTIGSGPAEGDTPDLGKTVRRKNACGALQCLTVQRSNRIPLVWTVGVLPALRSVLADTGSEGTHVTYPDARHRHEFQVARDRAILCLVNLATPRENRIPVFHAPELVHWLVAMILEGQGQPRKGACAVLAYLAKTVENRLLMVQVPRLVEALCRVLKRRPARTEFPRRPVPSDSSPETLTEEDGEEDDGEDNTTVGDHTNATGHRSEGTSPEEADPTVSKDPSAGSEPSRFVSVCSSYSNQSNATQRLAGATSPVELERYDETADEMLREARNYAFAALCNLVKEKDNAYHFARDTFLVKVIAEIAHCHDSPSHEHAAKFLAYLTRHRLNTKVIVFRRRIVVPALVEGTTSPSPSARLYSCYALQNLSQDKSCRQEMAITDNLLICLCERARGATDQEEERLAALSALKNLTDEPANLIPMSNTTDCIATLMHLAHGRQDGVTSLMQYRACDALATLSHWLRKIASSGQALTDARMDKTALPKKQTLFVPSLRVVTVNQWQ